MQVSHVLFGLSGFIIAFAGVFFWLVRMNDKDNADRVKKNFEKNPS